MPGLAPAFLFFEFSFGKSSIAIYKAVNVGFSFVRHCLISFIVVTFGVGLLSLF